MIPTSNMECILECKLTEHALVRSNDNSVSILDNVKIVHAEFFVSAGREGLWQRD